MEKIIVNPLEIRGLGDIISPKSRSDFNKYNSKITESTDVVDGQEMPVYSMVYFLVNMVLTVTKNHVQAGGNITFSVSVDVNNAPAEGATIEFYREVE